MRWAAILTLVLFLLGVCLPVALAQTTDGEIHDRVRLKLAGDRDVRGTQIQVEVEDGVVTLRGEVHNEKARKRAAKLAKKVKGVKKVINELTVRAK